MWPIQPWHWFVLGLLLITIEMFVPTFASIWFGSAAILVALITWLLPLALLIQVIVWLALSIVLIVLWFRFIKPLAIDRTKAGLGGSAIIGEVGMVVVASEQRGVVRFSMPIMGADEWACHSRTATLVVGERVRVVDILGNELVVSAHDPNASAGGLAR